MFQLEVPVDIHSFLKECGARYDKAIIPQITNIASIEQASNGSLCFLSKVPENGLNPLAQSSSDSVILVPNDYNFVSKENSPYIVHVLKPRQAFIKFVNEYVPAKEVDFEGVSHLADISPSVLLGDEVKIGSFARLARGVQIGSRSIVHPSVVLGPGTIVGKNVIIRPGAVIGFDGQASERQASGERVSLPHLGAVVIGDNCVIGSNTVICSGSLNNTIIGSGCTIGNIVNIGHNVIIGNDTFISANVTVCGSVKVGNGVWLSPACAILNKIIIGDEALVGLGAIVTKDVSRNGFVAGVSARQSSKISSSAYNLKE